MSLFATGGEFIGRVILTENELCVQLFLVEMMNLWTFFPRKIDYGSNEGLPPIASGVSVDSDRFDLTCRLHVSYDD